MSNIVVTGCTSGLGELIATKLSANGHYIIGIGQEADFDLPHIHEYHTVDLARMDAHAKLDAIAQDHLGLGHRLLDCVINCAGVNIINYLESATEHDWYQMMDVNAKSIFLTSKAFLSNLRLTHGTILNIISNASHMPMTCSLAYNASKGAAEIMTKQLARELTKRHGITVFGISPNKLKGTGMSDSIDKQVMESRGWSLEETQEYQRKGLLCGEETDPVQLAEFIGFLLKSKERHKYLTGCIIPYGL